MTEALPPLRDEKILITGPAGRVAFPLARRLAEGNEVWGIARLDDPAQRERLRAAGVRTRRVDLGAPDWGDLPDDFSLLLHLAAAIGPELDFDRAIDVNAVGTGRLMSRFRGARACLVTSTRVVHAEPADPHHAVLESDPLGGDEPLPYSPSYRVSKLGEEAVARFCAVEFELPTTIARLNVVYGDGGGLPALLLDGILADQPVPLRSGGATLCSLIHDDDIFAQLPGLLVAGEVPATLTHWGGDHAVDLREVCLYMGRLVGREVRFVESEASAGNAVSDPTRRRALAGPCHVDWREGIRRMIAQLHPELPLAD